MAIARAIDSIRNSLFDRRTHCGDLIDAGNFFSFYSAVKIVLLKSQKDAGQGISSPIKRSMSQLGEKRIESPRFD